MSSRLCERQTSTLHSIVVTDLEVHDHAKLKSFVLDSSRELRCSTQYFGVYCASAWTIIIGLIYLSRDTFEESTARRVKCRHAFSPTFLLTTTQLRLVIHL